MALSRPTRPHLRVVAGEQPSPWAPRAVMTNLTAHPFRPGETPNLVTLRLDEDGRELARTLAGGAQLPAPLALRLAAEAARAVTEVAAALGPPREWVTDACEVTLGDQAEQPTLVPLAAATLGAYAALLEAGAPPGRITACGLTLRLSDEMNGSWALAAAARGLTLEQWVVESARSAPCAFVRYEIAAARSAQTLAEWVYASSLRAAASSIA